MLANRCTRQPACRGWQHWPAHISDVKSALPAQALSAVAPLSRLLTTSGDDDANTPSTSGQGSTKKTALELSQLKRSLNLAREQRRAQQKLVQTLEKKLSNNVHGAVDLDSLLTGLSSSQSPAYCRRSAQGHARKHAWSPRTASIEHLAMMMLELSGRQQRTVAFDINSPKSVSLRVLELAKGLSMDAGTVALMCNEAPQLLNRRAEQALEVLEALRQGLGCTRSDAETLCSGAPALLLKQTAALLHNTAQVAAVLKSRGLQLLPLALSRPDLLLQKSASLAAKLDALPKALGVPQKAARDCVEACPQLLRRSPESLAQRMVVLQQLLGVPRAFVTELVCQEPRVLALSSGVMRAKFDALLSRYGSFQDDVSDMILVDPSLLLKAQHAPMAAVAQPQQTQQAPQVMPSSSASQGRLQAGQRTVADTQGAEVGQQQQQSQRQQEEQEEQEGQQVQQQQQGPALKRILRFAKASGVPVAQVLVLCCEHEPVVDFTPEELRNRLAALAGLLAVSPEAAQQVVLRHPGLLGLDPTGLEQRAEQLMVLIRPGAGGGAAVAGSSSGSSTGDVAARAALLREHPDLLLQEAEVVQAKLAALSALLNGLPLPRVLALVAAQPGLVAGRVEAPGPGAPFGRGEVADRLVALQSLLETPRGVVVELVTKEPGLLGVPASCLEAGFKALVTSFGSFRDDAIDIVLADPSLILKASFSSLDSMDESTEDELQAAVAGRSSGAADAAKASGAAGSVATGDVGAVQGAAAEGSTGASGKTRGRRTRQQKAAAISGTDGAAGIEDEQAVAAAGRARKGGRRSTNSSDGVDAGRGGSKKASSASSLLVDGPAPSAAQLESEGEARPPPPPPRRRRRSKDQDA